MCSSFRGTAGQPVSSGAVSPLVTLHPHWVSEELPGAKRSNKRCRLPVEAPRHWFIEVLGNRCSILSPRLEFTHTVMSCWTPEKKDFFFNVTCRFLENTSLGFTKIFFFSSHVFVDDSDGVLSRYKQMNNNSNDNNHHH